MSSSSSNVLPDPTSSDPKDRQVREMFGRIARTYDLLNHLLSLGIDQRWRRNAVRHIKVRSPARVLDLCGGTGGFGVELLKHRPEDQVIVADFCLPMLEKARKTFEGLLTGHGIACCDALQLPFPGESFDICLCGFGVRNWSDLETGLREVHRLLRSGGEFAVLDFFQAGRGFSDTVGRFYVRWILPTIGGLVSGNHQAYRYLADSMDGFCSSSDFARICSRNGFEVAHTHRFVFGLCHLFILRKTG